MWWQLVLLTSSCGEPHSSRQDLKYHLFASNLALLDRVCLQQAQCLSFNKTLLQAEGVTKRNACIRTLLKLWSESGHQLLIWCETESFKNFVCEFDCGADFLFAWSTHCKNVNEPFPDDRFMETRRRSCFSTWTVKMTERALIFCAHMVGGSPSVYH